MAMAMAGRSYRSMPAGLPGGNRGQRFSGLLHNCENFMASFSCVRMILAGCLLVVAAPALVWGQGSYARQGGEYNLAGALAGDQVYPHASIKTTGGYVVWQDNFTDGAGLGISARKLDSSLSGSLSTFRVNENGTNDQERAQVSMLNDGGAIFVWQGGKQSFQHIYARVRSAGGIWTTGDVLVNTPTNVFQREVAITTLAGGNAVVVWGSFNQASGTSYQDVYSQILTPAGVKAGGETLVNVTTAYNQRSAAVASLSDGRYVVVWVSEQQRFQNSVDVYGRVFTANGGAASGEFLINSGTNVCASPNVAPSADGGFIVAWMQYDALVSSNSWDVFARPFSGAGFGGVTRRVNTQVYGDQLGPKIRAVNSDYLMVWTSMGQDGSSEGVYGQMLASDGALSGGEFRVNTTTPSQQIHPAVASDGIATFLTVWTGFIGGPNSFDLFAQRYASTNQPLSAPGAPIVTVLSSNALSVSWPPVQGFSIANYEIYAEPAGTATAVVTNTYWTATGLAPSSIHSYRLAYVVADGRRSPLSGATTNTTYATLWYYNEVPSEWMSQYWGAAFWTWPLPGMDSDGDGASNRDEFLAGTDPTDGNSVLRIRLQPTVQGLYLNWNTQVGLMYQVQTTATAGGAWSNLGGPRFAGATVDSLYVGGGATGYYRIVRLR